MKFKLLKYLIITVLIAFSGCSKTEIGKKDGPKIIALSPSLAETVFYLGSGDDLAGVSSFCSFPEEVKKIPVVANVTDINTELVLKMQPDVLFLMPSQKDIADKLSLLNIRTSIVSQESLDDILHSFEVIGYELGKAERGKFISDSLRTLAAGYKKPLTGKKIMISVGREYGTAVTYIFSNGRNGFLNDIIELFGYGNALDTDVPYPKIGVETIMTLDPDIILDLVPSNVNLSPEELLKDWSLLENTRAFKNGGILIFSGDHTTIPGPRIFDFIKELKEKGL
ncbi:MAG TPA: ABC transporter substrate-binding protein [Clostridiales bacterium]|nr:ABC transporter substrate-binding protein [Clostridiales bacterium]HQP70743.1 ABC transporter substrate-binding protein [Clostridiales bacterium]